MRLWLWLELRVRVPGCLQGAQAAELELWRVRCSVARAWLLTRLWRRVEWGALRRPLAMVG